MKYASPALKAYLAANDHYLMADLITVELQNGTVYYWCDGDMDITLAGQLFTASVDQGGQPLIDRGDIRQARGLEVSTLDLTMDTGDTAQLLGVGAALAVHNGAFDLATVRVERVFMPTWGDTSLGSVLLFEGEMASADVGSTQMVVHVKSLLQRLTVQMPRDLFLPACSNAFGDASCRVDLASLTVSGVVGAGSTNQCILGAPAQADQYYQIGIITMTSGATAGAQAAIAAYLSGALYLSIPLPATPAPGDTFTVRPGCARTIAACTAYSNLTRFRGFPWVPPPELGL